VTIRDYTNYSIEDLLAQAKERDIDAMHELGNRYLTGKGVRKNQPKAFRTYEEAAECPDSIWYGAIHEAVGDCHFYGIGTHEDEKAAFRSYQAGAASHYPKSVFSVGLCYLHGYGTRQDLIKAVDQFESAAKSHLPDAEYELGAILLTTGPLYNKQRGEELITRAALQGHAAAQESKARLLTDGLIGNTKDEATMDLYCQAYAWLILASATNPRYSKYRDIFLGQKQDFILRGQKIAREIELKIRSKQHRLPSPSPADLLGLNLED